MNKLILILLIIIPLNASAANLSYEITKENASEYNIEVMIEKDNKNNIYHVSVLFPSELNEKMKFWYARLSLIEGEGNLLFSKNNNVLLSFPCGSQFPYSSDQDKSNKIYFQAKEEILKSCYITLNYGSLVSTHYTININSFMNPSN